MKLVPKSSCCGCTACAAICPKKAITIQPDDEGFLCPEIDVSTCVGCGLCAKVCPVLNVGEARMPLAVYAAKAKDQELRLASSSGGLFTLLANETLAKNGIVWGAAFDHVDWHVYHCGVERVEDLSELRGSKYAQSDIGDSLQKVAQSLADGRAVLFTGTPCQIAALRRYLFLERVDVSNLMLVEVVCHAVPSPLVWKKYLEKRVAVAYGAKSASLRQIMHIFSRSKSRSWKRYEISLSFENAIAYSRTFSEDSFMRAFLSELCNRPSCHRCTMRGLRSGADLSIADYWNVDTKFPDIDDDKGVSLVLVNTSKGRELFDDIARRIEKRISDFAHAAATNPAIVRSSCCHKKRVFFFDNLMKSDFDGLVEKCLRQSIYKRVRHGLGSVLRRVGLRK